MGRNLARRLAFAGLFVSFAFALALVVFITGRLLAPSALPATRTAVAVLAFVAAAMVALLFRIARRVLLRRFDLVDRPATHVDPFGLDARIDRALLHNVAPEWWPSATGDTIALDRDAEVEHGR